MSVVIIKSKLCSEGLYLECLISQGEDGIDLSRIDNSRNIAEFDQEAQVAIERVTYDHHMKMMGKPTSSEQV